MLLESGQKGLRLEGRMANFKVVISILLFNHSSLFRCLGYRPVQAYLLYSFVYFLRFQCIGPTDQGHQHGALSATSIANADNYVGIVHHNQFLKRLFQNGHDIEKIAFKGKQFFSINIINIFKCILNDILGVLQVELIIHYGMPERSRCVPRYGGGQRLSMVRLRELLIFNLMT